jgi:hypothetical protein
MMSLSLFEGLELDGYLSDSAIFPTTAANKNIGSRQPKDLLASIEHLWREGAESPEVLAETIADFGAERRMELPCLSQSAAPVKVEEPEEEKFCVASPDSGIEACYDLDSNALLCGSEDPEMGLPFDLDLFEATTSTNGVMPPCDSYSLDTTAALASGSKEDDMDIILPDSFMVTEEAIQEAPVIICDVAPIDIAEATALASPDSSGEVETGIKKSAATFTVRPPLRRRRKGGRRDAVPTSPVSKVVLKVKPFAFAPPKSDEVTPPSGNRIGGSGGSSRKRKLYELGPLDNPDAERCRLNALNAKKNREKKKRQLAEAALEIDRLRSENSVLRTEADEVRDQLEHARRELARLRAQVKANGVLTPPGGTSLGNGNLQQPKWIA